MWITRKLEFLLEKLNLFRYFVRGIKHKDVLKMYTTIMTIVFFVLIIINLIIIAISTELLKAVKLKKYFTIVRLIRVIVLVEFTVFNFLLSFAKAEYLFQLVLQIITNIVAIIYFIVDLIYISQKTRNYILWLQNIVFNKTSFKDTFEILDAEGVGFKEDKKIENQLLAIVEAGKGKGLCIYVPSRNGGILLKPKVEMNKETLMFYAQKIEVDIDDKEKLRFYKGDIPADVVSEYDYGVTSKIYIWIRDVLLSEKGKTIMLLVFIALFIIILLVFLIFYECSDYELLDYFFSIKIT